jgi:transmembrane sensor
VTDIGTEFVVDRGDRLRVAVREGEVEVAKGSETVRLKAGQGAEFEARARPFKDAANQFAWRDGRIVLNSVPLDDALHELGRYYPGSIELTDDSLASRRVSGTLFIADPEEALETIARSQHLKLTHFLWITRVSPDRK